MRCHNLTYKVHGEDLQFVSIGLDKDKTVIAEAGSMLYMSESILLDTKLDDGSNPNDGLWDKIWSAGKRAVTGESFFLAHFTCTGNVQGQVAFSGPYPGKIIPLDLSTFKTSILCQRGAFLCAAYGTKIDIAFTQNLGAGFFGGEGFILQRLTGDGMAFVHACGKIIEIPLNNQTIRVSPGCIVGFEEGIKYSITAAGSIKTMLFGAKSIFFATLSGTGRVWLQSLPFNLLSRRICEEGLQQGLFNNKREGGHTGTF